MSGPRRHCLAVLCSIASIIAACSGGGGGGTPDAGGGDTTPPTVSSTNPANGATGVSVGTTVSATFSEPMKNSTLNASTFTLAVTGGAALNGSVGVSGNTATFTPSAALAQSTSYTATITTGAQDAAGNALEAAFTWSFTTADTTPPTVVSTNLTEGQKGTFDTAFVAVTFSEAMDPATLTPATFTLSGPAGAVAGTVTYDVGTDTATFTPEAPLASNSAFTATVTTGATDLAGNGLASPFTLHFTTATATFRAFTTAPGKATSLVGTVVLVNPSTRATTPFPALVNPLGFTSEQGRVAYLPTGTYDTINKRIDDSHRHAVLFANGGSIFGLSAVVSDAPAPVQISRITPMSTTRSWSSFRRAPTRPATRATMSCASSISAPLRQRRPLRCLRGSTRSRRSTT